MKITKLYALYILLPARMAAPSLAHFYEKKKNQHVSENFIYYFYSILGLVRRVVPGWWTGALQ